MIICIPSAAQNAVGNSLATGEAITMPYSDALQAELYDLADEYHDQWEGDYLEIRGTTPGGETWYVRLDSRPPYIEPEEP